MDRIIISEEDEKFLLDVKDALSKKQGEFKVNISMADTFEVYVERHEISAVFNSKGKNINVKMSVKGIIGTRYLGEFNLTPNLVKKDFKYSEVYGMDKQYMQHIRG